MLIKAVVNYWVHILMCFLSLTITHKVSRVWCPGTNCWYSIWWHTSSTPPPSWNISWVAPKEYLITSHCANDLDVLNDTIPRGMRHPTVNWKEKVDSLYNSLVSSTESKSAPEVKLKLHTFQIPIRYKVLWSHGIYILSEKMHDFLHTRMTLNNHLSITYNSKNESLTSEVEISRKMTSLGDG